MNSVDSSLCRNLSKQALSLLSTANIDVTGGVGQTVLELALQTENCQIIEAVINKGHSHFHPAIIKRSLDLLNTESLLSISDREQVRQRLSAELEPDTLENLCVSMISRSMKRRLSKVCLLPCSSKMKEKIKEKGRTNHIRRQRSLEEITDEKLAYDFLRLL